MSSFLPLLAWSLEVHNPDHMIQLDDHWGGILCIVIGVFFLFGPLTSYKSMYLTRWLRLNYDERPSTGFERFLAVVICFGLGIYLLRRS